MLIRISVDLAASIAVASGSAAAAVDYVPDSLLLFPKLVVHTYSHVSLYFYNKNEYLDTGHQL